MAASSIWLSIISRIIVLGRSALEQALPERVDALALLVHDLVVFEQVLADVEVALLDLLLRALDPAADHLALDGLAFLHAQPGEHGGDPLAGELAHQVVFEREEEPATSPGSPWRPERPRSWLSIRRLSCRSVPMMCRPPNGGDLAPLGLHLGLVADRRPSSQTSLETSSRVGYWAAVFVGLTLEVGPGHELGVAAQDDVGAAAGHVGGDRHGPAWRPAWATISASRSWYLAFRTWCGMPIAA